MRTDFIQAQTQEERLKIIEAFSKRLWEIMPYVVTGQYDAPYAWRTNVTGVLPTSKIVFWNIAKN